MLLTETEIRVLGALIERADHDAGILSGHAERVDAALKRFGFRHLEDVGGTRYYFAMVMSVDEITEEAIKLDPSARAVLADKLIESLESEEPDEIQRLWAVEAIRRRDEVRAGAGKVQPVDGEQVLEEVRRLVGR